MREFSKNSRLLTGSDYKKVFNSSRRFSDAYFLVLASSNQGANARLGMAISKKKLQSAVQRNRLKRIIRESFRHHKTSLAGKDVVVLANNSVHKAKNQALTSSLESIWKKIEKCEKC